MSKEMKPRWEFIARNSMWITREGNRIKLTDMSDFHMVNAIRSLVRCAHLHAVIVWYVVLKNPASYELSLAEIHRECVRKLREIFDVSSHEITSEFWAKGHFGTFVCLWFLLEERGIDWWDHHWKCSCEDCEELKEQNHQYLEENPDYVPVHTTGKRYA